MPLSVSKIVPLKPRSEKVNKKKIRIAAMEPITRTEINPFSHFNPMKNKSTKEALTIATPKATGVFNIPKSTLDMATVKTVKISSAIKVPI